MKKRLIIFAALLGLALTSGSVTAHKLKKTVTTKQACETLDDAKKQSACKACFTKNEGKTVHYHPLAKKKGNKCHAVDFKPAKTKGKTTKDTPTPSKPGC